MVNAQDITRFGAVGDGSSPCGAAFAAAVEAVRALGGGTVYVPPGRFLTGTVRLASNVTLHLDAGAVIVGSSDPADYPLIPTRWEGAATPGHAALVHGEDLERVTITGQGTIDGRGQAWWDRVRAGTLEHPRPRLVNFRRCRGLRIEGVTLTNSPSWTVNPIECDDVVLDRLTVRNPADSPNTDGLNPESCRNVRITNCLIDVGDDCITIKAGVRAEADQEPPGPCRNVVISNCTLLNGHGGVVIGSEMSGGVKNVAICNCVFEGTDRGVRIKSRRGRGGVVEDIRVSNLIMDRVWAAFTVNLYYRCGTPPGQEAYIRDPAARPVDERTPVVRDIHLCHVTARAIEGQAAVMMLGLPESPIRGVTLDDVVLETTDAPGTRDERPVMVDLPLPETHGECFARHVEALTLSRSSLPGRRGVGLRVEHARRVRLSDVTCPAAAGDQPAVRFEDVEGASVDGLYTPGGDEAAWVSTHAATAASHA